MRCDNKNDCDDGSDEMNCKYLPNLENYNKGIAPMTMNINKNSLATKDTDIEMGKCSVYVSTTINTFRSVEAQKYRNNIRIDWPHIRQKQVNLCLTFSLRRKTETGKTK